MKPDKKEKRDLQIKTLKRTFRYLRGYRLQLVGALVSATVATLATLYAPRVIGRAVDRMIGPGEVDFVGLRADCLALATCAFVAGVAQFVMTRLNNRVAFGVARDIRVDAFRRLQKLPLGYLDGKPYGETSSRIVTDADLFSDGLLTGFSQFFTGIVAIVGVLCFMASLSLPITFVVVALTPLSLVAAWFISKKSFVYFHRQSSLRGEETGYVMEATSGARTLQAFDRGEASSREFEEIDERLTRVSLLAVFFSSLTNPATRFVNSLVYAGVGVCGGLAVLHGTLSVGNLTTFLSYADQYTKPFNEISGVLTELQNSLACGARLFELIDAEEETPDAVDAASPELFVGGVEFDRVTFSYRPDRPLIENFSLKARPGAKIAIVGPTGCGKTTLVNLLMRFYDAQGGAIRLDGFETRRLTRASLRRGFGMVLQETWLRAGTVRENIAMDREDISDAELRQIARACHLDAFISRLPHGFDTRVTPNGGEFSQGERQLLCIARVMARRPDLLILDEATSSIDTRTELKIQDAFNRLMADRTSFVVAHRLSTIRSADVILAMKDGKIVEQGTHEELLAAKGFYYQLYMSQFPSTNA